MRKPKVNTFSKSLTLEEAQKEKEKGSQIGETLKRADKQYNEWRNK